MSGVNIKYKGESIATIPDTGSKTIKTQGKYCEGDILVEYESPLVPALTPIEEKDVNFYDYDGTVLYAYTTQEALALAELPEAPTHDGLTFQGWNRTLAQLQNYVADYGIGNVGTTYITNDGVTRLYLEVEEGALLDYELYVQIANGILSVEVDGVELGSATETLSSYVNYTIPFTLPSRDNVRIDLKFIGTGGFHIGQGSLRNRIFGQNSNQNDTLVKVEFGEHITSIENSAFYGCTSLNSIVIPDNVTSIESGAFRSCISLNNVVIPDSVTIIKSGAFSNCISLYKVMIPDSVASIQNSAFHSCTFLNNVVIPNNGISVGGSVFSNCTSLNNIVIPDSVTIIESGLFSDCISLNNVVIPDSVTSIKSGAFQGCAFLLFFDLSQHNDPNNLPALEHTSALNGTPTDQTIYVYDQTCLDTLSTMTNWSTYADRFQIKGVTP